MFPFLAPKNKNNVLSSPITLKVSLDNLLTLI
jgi:hypothetical protein